MANEFAVIFASLSSWWSAAAAQSVVLAFKSICLLAATGLVARMLSRHSAAARHCVWTIGVIAVLAQPALTWALPHWRVLPTITMARPGWADGFLCWSLAGAAVIAALLMTRILFAQWRLRQLAARSGWLSDGRLHDRLQWVCVELGIKRSVRLLVSAERAVPMTWGVFRSHLLLPAVAAEWSERLLESVLRHELAHIRRRDCLTQLLAQWMAAVYWFNPLAWLAVDRLRWEREAACDDLVLGSGLRATDYAESLLNISISANGQQPPAAAVAMSESERLEARMLQILDPHRQRRPMSRLSMVGVGSLALALAATTAAVSTRSPIGSAQAAGVNRVDLAESVAAVAAAARVAAATDSSAAAPTELLASDWSGRGPAAHATNLVVESHNMARAPRPTVTKQLSPVRRPWITLQILGEPETVESQATPKAPAERNAKRLDRSRPGEKVSLSDSPPDPRQPTRSDRPMAL
ncbi:MAG: M56 family metallopeptidase [Pirellulaceae bacterium]|nr:M56 family metallopeptidase [Pirellulaceae bacterium]MDP7017171.1 M56 family metallopeptidase [Pirellulaceae bacterium]